MKTQLDTHAHAPPNVSKTGAIASGTRLAHGHETQGLCRRETRRLILVEQGFGFGKEMITGRTGVGRIGSCSWFVRVMTSVRANGIDQQRRAVFVPTLVEILVEALATEDYVEGVTPSEVQIKQSVNEC